MPVSYTNAKQNFSTMDAFKEVAVKTINEIYGRVKPLDIFDFSETDTEYTCIAYHEDEQVPEYQAEGAVLSLEAQRDLEAARAQEQEALAAAAAEAQANADRIQAIVQSGGELTQEDIEIGLALGIIRMLTDEETTAQLEAQAAAEEVIPEATVDVGEALPPEAVEVPDVTTAPEEDNANADDQLEQNA